MCPGLTSPGGKMEDVEEGECVQVTAEGTFHACAVGVMTMSSADVTKAGIGHPVLRGVAPVAIEARTLR